MESFQNADQVTVQARQFLQRSQCVVGEPWACCKIEPVVTATERIPSKSLPRAPECGTDTGDRIVGGEATRIDEFPWLALLVKRIKSRE